MVEKTCDRHTGTVQGCADENFAAPCRVEDEPCDVWQSVSLTASSSYVGLRNDVSNSSPERLVSFRWVWLRFLIQTARFTVSSPHRECVVTRRLAWLAVGGQSPVVSGRGGNIRWLLLLASGAACQQNGAASAASWLVVTGNVIHSASESARSRQFSARTTQHLVTRRGCSVVCVHCTAQGGAENARVENEPHRNAGLKTPNFKFNYYFNTVCV